MLNHLEHYELIHIFTFISLWKIATTENLLSDFFSFSFFLKAKTEKLREYNCALSGTLLQNSFGDESKSGKMCSLFFRQSDDMKL